jgi:hypothetical protein
LLSGVFELVLEDIDFVEKEDLHYQISILPALCALIRARGPMPVTHDRRLHKPCPVSSTAIAGANRLRD